MIRRLIVALCVCLWLMPAAESCGGPRRFRSLNGRYAFFPDSGVLASEDREIFSHRGFRCDRACVADDGSAVFAYTESSWLALDDRGAVVAGFPSADDEAGPGAMSSRLHPPPLELLIDRPRTCWQRGTATFVEFEQGGLLKFQGPGWKRVTRLEASPLPPCVQRTLYPDVPVRRWKTTNFDRKGFPRYLFDLKFRQPDVFDDYGYPDRATTKALQKKLRKGDGTAALLLGYLRCADARPDLIQLAQSSQAECEAAQRALMLLDGESAASALVPTLANRVDLDTLYFFGRVRCPEAIPGLIEHLPDSQVALQFQTGVDRGTNREAWRAWLRDCDLRRLQADLGRLRGDKNSELLWRAHSGLLLDVDLKDTPRLLFRVARAGVHTTGLFLEEGRLTRTEGDTRQRVLQWDVLSGTPQLTLPEAVPDNAKFAYSFAHQLLFVQTSRQRWLWQRGRCVWQGLVPTEYGNVAPFIVQQPEPVTAWLSEGDHLRFSPDGRLAFVAKNEEEQSYALGAEWNETPKPVARKGLLAEWIGRTWTREHWLNPGSEPRLDLENSNPRELHSFFSTRLKPIGRANTGEDRYDIFARLRDAETSRTVAILPEPGSVVAADKLDRFVVVQDVNEDLAVYELSSSVPDLNLYDPVVLAECWTGFRLQAGGAIKLSAEELQQRRRTLRQSSSAAASWGLVFPSLAVVGLMVALGWCRKTSSL